MYWVAVKMLALQEELEVQRRGNVAFVPHEFDGFLLQIGKQHRVGVHLIVEELTLEVVFALE